MESHSILQLHLHPSRIFFLHITQTNFKFSSITLSPITSIHYSMKGKRSNRRWRPPEIIVPSWLQKENQVAVQVSGESDLGLSTRNASTSGDLPTIQQNPSSGWPDLKIASPAAFVIPDANAHTEAIGHPEYIQRLRELEARLGYTPVARYIPESNTPKYVGELEVVGGVLCVLEPADKCDQLQKVVKVGSAKPIEPTPPTSDPPKIPATTEGGDAVVIKISMPVSKNVSYMASDLKSKGHLVKFDPNCRKSKN